MSTLQANICDEHKVLKIVSELAVALKDVCKGNATNANKIHDICNDQKNGLLALMLQIESKHSGFFDMISIEMERQREGVNLMSLVSILTEIGKRINQGSLIKTVVSKLQEIQVKLIECENNRFVMNFDSALTRVIQVAACGAIGLSLAYFTIPGVATAVNSTASTTAKDILTLDLLKLYGKKLQNIVLDRENALKGAIRRSGKILESSHPIVSFALNTLRPSEKNSETAQTAVSLAMHAEGAGVVGLGMGLTWASKDKLKRHWRRWRGESEAGAMVRVPAKRSHEDGDGTSSNKRAKTDLV